MAKTEKDTTVHVADVVRHGEKLVVPSGMSLRKARELLDRMEKYEEEVIEIKEAFNCFVWDGALALQKAMTAMFGWASAEPIPGMFGDAKPNLIAVECDLNKTILVPWGRFTLPNIEGWVETGLTRKDGKITFSLHMLVVRKFEPLMRQLVELTREIAAKESLYRGKAIRIRFTTGGSAIDMPMPQFLDLRRIKAHELVFSKDVQNAIETSVFTPIEQAQRCREYKIPLKRGILLSGPYGTGKTLAAYVTAKKCLEHGWTFLYCERASELAEMVRFAKQYEPAVIFCEDIDREVAGERSVAMDDILNIIDGIESKDSEIMIILTTNHVENIAKAMLRPGRLDAVINVLPPDSEAVQKLIRLYGGKSVEKEADLSAASEVLAGNIPAVIRECVERSKLAAIKNSDASVNGSLRVSGDDLLEAAKTMKLQLDLLKEQQPVTTVTEAAGHGIRELMVDALKQFDDR